MKFGIGEWVVADFRVGIVNHYDERLPLPYSVAFVDNGEVESYSSKELRSVREAAIIEFL